MDLGLEYIESLLKGTVEVEAASTVFTRVWDARLVETDLARTVQFLLGDGDEVLALAARLREAQASADEPSVDPRLLASLLVVKSLGDAVDEDARSLA